MSLLQSTRSNLAASGQPHTEDQLYEAALILYLRQPRPRRNVPLPLPMASQPQSDFDFAPAFNSAQPFPCAGILYPTIVFCIGPSRVRCSKSKVRPSYCTSELINAQPFNKRSLTLTCGKPAPLRARVYGERSCMRGLLGPHYMSTKLCAFWNSTSVLSLSTDEAYLCFGMTFYIAYSSFSLEVGSAFASSPSI